MTLATFATAAPTPVRIPPADIDRYRREGLTVVRGLLDRARLLEPLWAQLRELIDLAREQCGLPPAPAGGAFDAGLPEIVASHRRVAGKIYDAAKMLPAFASIASSRELFDLVAALLDTDMPGWYPAGSGARMDHPGESRFLTHWHQDYHAHLCSSDLVVLWIPLVPVDEEVGSVVLCPGSHREGMAPIHLHDPLNCKRNATEAMDFFDIEERAGKYPQIGIDTEPGDVLAFHGLLMHRSRPNLSHRTRWSLQLRYMNFRDPDGRRHFWTPGMNAGVDIRAIHPDVVVDCPTNP